MKKVVCIGGGTGQSALLRGLKQIDNIELTTIVAVADNGGSTGKLRDALHLPAMGDIRSVMIALAEREDLMKKIMSYRFGSDANELSNHSVGNIIISALAIQDNDFLQAITDLSEVLHVKGTILPSTLDNISLKAHMQDGTIITGETELRESPSKIRDVFYEGEVKSYPRLVNAILEADYVIIGIGSLYTSVMPCLIINDIASALANTQAKIVYYCNAMTEKGETDYYSLEDHVDAINKHLKAEVIDAVVYANDDVSEETMEAYAKEQAQRVYIADKRHNYEIFEYNLLDFSKGQAKHSDEKIRDSFIDVMRRL